MLYRIKKPESQIYSGIFLQKNGGPGGIRTPDPTLRRRVLYPTELLTQK